MSAGGRDTRTVLAVAVLWLLSAVVLAARPAVAGRGGTGVVALLSLPLAAATATAVAVRAQPDRRAVVVALAAGVVLVAASAAIDWTPGLGLGKVLLGAGLGVLAASLLDEPWHVALIAVLVVGVDIYSVFAGPTRAIVEDQPGLLSALTVPLAAPGRPRAALLGITDFVFLALFCAAVLRWHLRPRLTAALLTASLSGTIALAAHLDRALPALPLLSAAFVLPNLPALVPWRWSRRA